MLRRLVAAMTAALIGIVGGSVLLARPAEAYPISFCNDPIGDLCYYYSPNFLGAYAGIWQAVPDLLNPRGTYPDNSLGSPYQPGTGQQIGNNAASAQNHDRITCVATIFYRANYNAGYPSAPKISLQPGQAVANLGSLRNNNRSHTWNC
ncbi:peptidase inhibitor family I36 protein [Phytohabitans houttuyneae]|uniref:peptidase inhibitor family I36 protein n=1 Tax=Phytohabitans houttuyneae TaxID=1076126 RepID=UPI0015678873